MHGLRRDFGRKEEEEEERGEGEGGGPERETWVKECKGHVTWHSPREHCLLRRISASRCREEEHGCHASRVTRCTSHVARHTSHVTRHTSHVTRHTSHVTRHTSHVTRYTSHVTRHTSHVTRHTSHVTPHLSHVMHPPCCTALSKSLYQHNTLMN
jgi:hypothetical protein